MIVMGVKIDDKIIKQIEEGLSQIRPHLEADGGDVSLVEVTDDYIVKVKFLGACKDCDVSLMTLKAGIEQAVKRHCPQVKRVIDIDNI